MSGENETKKPGVVRKVAGGCAALLLGFCVLSAMMKAKDKVAGKSGGLSTSSKVDKMWFLAVEARGTNGLRVEFGLTEGTRYKATTGEIVVSLRPWTGAGTDNEIARITQPVTTADFHKNSVGTPLFRADLAFEPNRAMPSTTTWLEVEVTVTPTGGSPVSDTTKIIHQQVVFRAPAATPDSPTSPAASGGVPDIRTVLGKADPSGRYRAKFTDATPIDQGLLMILDSADSPGQKKGIAALLPDAIHRQIGDSVITQILSEKPVVIVVLGAGETMPIVRALMIE